MTKWKKYVILSSTKETIQNECMFFIVEEGGYIWVDARKEDGNYIQCLNCGNIYIMERKVPISVSIVKSECPKCRHGRGLNCGDKKEDIYYFYDGTLDERYY